MTLQLPFLPWKYFKPNPAKRFLSMTDSPGVLNPAKIDQIFQDLKPIKPDNLIGEWDGFILPTGHPFEDDLEDLNWFGNTFDSMDDVAPLMVAKNGERVRFEEWGGASLCEIKYYGVVSAALIYDERPVKVHYRAVRSDMVACIMESKRFEEKVYFYLTK
ncbi:hypothetical protein N7490_000877 [Penicillium lividum]|nr:hypothetical protein N7490_000877 [Penicillium lividum]